MPQKPSFSAPRAFPSDLNPANSETDVAEVLDFSTLRKSNDWVRPNPESSRRSRNYSGDERTRSSDNQKNYGHLFTTPKPMLRSEAPSFRPLKQQTPHTQDYTRVPFDYAVNDPRNGGRRPSYSNIDRPRRPSIPPSAANRNVPRHGQVATPDKQQPTDLPQPLNNLHPKNASSPQEAERPTANPVDRASGVSPADATRPSRKQRGRATKPKPPSSSSLSADLDLATENLKKLVLKQSSKSNLNHADHDASVKVDGSKQTNAIGKLEKSTVAENTSVGSGQQDGGANGKHTIDDAKAPGGPEHAVSQKKKKKRGAKKRKQKENNVAENSQNQPEVKAGTVKKSPPLTKEPIQRVREIVPFALIANGKRAEKDGVASNSESSGKPSVSVKPAAKSSSSTLDPVVSKEPERESRSKLQKPVALKEVKGENIPKAPKTVVSNGLAEHLKKPADGSNHLAAETEKAVRATTTEHEATKKLPSQKLEPADAANATLAKDEKRRRKNLVRNERKRAAAAEKKAALKAVDQNVIPFTTFDAEIHRESSPAHSIKKDALTPVEKSSISNDSSIEKTIGDGTSNRRRSSSGSDLAFEKSKVTVTEPHRVSRRADKSFYSASFRSDDPSQRRSERPLSARNWQTPPQPPQRPPRYDRFSEGNIIPQRPQGNFVRPQGSFVRPQGSFERSQGSFERPQGSFVRPQGSFVRPQGSLVRPQDSYVRPQDNYMRFDANGLHRVQPRPPYRSPRGYINRNHPPLYDPDRDNRSAQQLRARQSVPPGSKPKRPTFFSEHLPHTDELLSRSNQTTYYKGVLRVNKKRRTDAYVTAEGLDADVYVPGAKLRNRAFNNDTVVIRILSEEEAIKSYPKEHFSVKMGGPKRDRRELANKQVGVPGNADEDGSGSSATEELEEDLTVPDDEFDGDAPFVTEDSEVVDDLDDGPKIFGEVVAILNAMPSRRFAGTLLLDRPRTRKEPEEHKTDKTSEGAAQTTQPNGVVKNKVADCGNASGEGAKDEVATEVAAKIEVAEHDGATNEVAKENATEKEIPQDNATNHTVANEDAAKGEVSQDAVIEIAVLKDGVNKGAAAKDGVAADRNTNGEKPPRKMRSSHVWFKPTDMSAPLMCIDRRDIPAEFLEDPKKFEGHLCLVEISQWPAYCIHPWVKFIKDLGISGNIETETEALLASHGSGERVFSQDVLNCLPALPWQISEEEIGKRRDLRQQRIFTIDPATAKDLDDAISLERLEDGNFEVGVHIADVTHFIKQNSALDREAADRATTVYLVQKIVPMLPPLLCEELCSLQPGVDRLAFSVVWKMSPEGEILDTWFGRTVIRSVCKLAYEHAQEVIDNGTINSTVPLHGNTNISDIESDIVTFYDLSRKLRSRRFENGALSMNSIKLAFSLDESGLPFDCHVYQQKESNRLIEEFMLLANTSVAAKIAQAFPDQSLLRRHPALLRDAEYVKDAARLGFKVDASTAGNLQESFDEIEQKHGTDVVQVLKLLCIRPMKRAVYFCTGSLQMEQFRHYALNTPLYTHFTSPIRRYADVIVHRLLDFAIRDRPRFYCSREQVRLISERCNNRKDAAKSAQEQSSHLYLCAYIHAVAEGKKGLEDLEDKRVTARAIVVRVQDRSYDVLLPDYGIESRIQLEDLDLVKSVWDEKKLTHKLYWKPQNASVASATEPESEPVPPLDPSTKGNGSPAVTESDGSAPVGDDHSAPSSSAPPTVELVRAFTNLRVSLTALFNKSPPCIKVNGIAPSPSDA